MKSFLEEYGIVVVVALVIIALIGIALFFTQIGPGAFRDFLNKFLNEGGINDVTIPEPAGDGGGGE